MELYTTHGEFDPRITSVVRVDATRLRTKLREYYAAEGALGIRLSSISQKAATLRLFVKPQFVPNRPAQPWLPLPNLP
jgi:hypothetical protein